MKKGILIQAMLAIAAVAAVMAIYISSTGSPVLTRLKPGQTIDRGGINGLADTENNSNIPETQDEAIIPEIPEIVPQIAPEELHNKETEQQPVLTNAESAFVSLVEYIRAYNGILLPPALLPPEVPHPQANQHEMDGIDADKIFSMGYLPAAAFAGTLETGNICENLRVNRSNMTLRLCESNNCNNGITKDIRDVALIIFPSDDSFISNISYSPELPEGYNARNFTVSVRNTKISAGIDEENYSLYGDLLVATRKQLRKTLCE